MQSEPVAVECLRDNGCSIDTLNSTSCPMHVRGKKKGKQGRKGKKEKWSDEERMWLWECHLTVHRGGKRDGYQKKVYD